MERLEIGEIKREQDLRISIPRLKRWAKEKTGKTRKLAEKIADYLNLDENSQSCIVDLGCGTGALGVEIARLHPLVEVFGYDIKNHLDESLKFPSNFDHRLMEPFKLHGEKLKPDSIILSGVIHHVPKNREQTFIQDVRASLCDGGKLFIHEHRISEFPQQFLEKGLLTLAEIVSNRCLETMETSYNFLTKNHLRQLLEDNGFRILKEETVGGRYVTIPQLANNTILLAEKF